MSDFNVLLGVKPDASLVEIKQAYHRLARRNHPDLYTADQKELQELRMMALNEAYTALTKNRSDPTFAQNGKPTATTVPPPSSVPENQVGNHREPAYAYYKQGFIHFSRAIHGIEALYQRLRVKRIKPRSYNPRHDAYHRFTSSLVSLSRANAYFSRVVQEYPQSMWRRDAELKLRRIARFSVLYRRIIANYRDPADEDQVSGIIREPKPDS
jgi:curved DNA-binding protein CbpA